MIRNLILLICVCIACGGFGYIVAVVMRPAPADFTVIAQGTPVKNFVFADIRGTKHILSDYDDRYILVHFWATWCPPCVVEFPDIVALARNNPDVIVIAVSSDKKADSIDRFLSKYVPAYPDNIIMVHDIDKSITEDRFGTFALPETYILSPGLVYKEKIVGAYKGWGEITF